MLNPTSAPYAHTLRRLPYGPDAYWQAKLARIGHSIVWATRLVGRWYYVRLMD